MKYKLSLKIKLVIAILIVILSLLLGFYSKVLFFLHLPYYFDTWNLFLYIISWFMLFVAAFFVGKEILELAYLYVKQKLQESYDLTIALQKKGFQKTHAFGKKTIALHKKMLGIDDINFK